MKHSDICSKRSGYWVYGAAALSVAAALLLKTAEVADGVRAGLSVCGGVVIPSLFPFMILAGLIGSTRAGAALSRAVYSVTRRLPGLKNLPERLGSALLMSFIGGFPVGAQVLSGMVENGELDGKTASRALCFSVNAGPSFLISAVGMSMLGSREAGLLLLLAQVLSSLLIAAFLFRSRSNGADTGLNRGATSKHAARLVADANHEHSGRASAGTRLDTDTSREHSGRASADTRFDTGASREHSGRASACTRFDTDTSREHSGRESASARFDTDANREHSGRASASARFDTDASREHFVRASAGARFDTDASREHFVRASAGIKYAAPANRKGGVSASDRFVAAVRGASAGILGICAFVVTFSAISSLLAALGVTSLAAAAAAKLFPSPALGAGFFPALLTGLLEVTGGCAAAAALNNRAGFVLCAFLISFSSLSIIFQVKSCFKPGCGVGFSAFYQSRLAHGGLTALFSLPLSLLLPPDALAAAVTVSSPVPSVTPNMAVTAVCLICMCSILLASTSKFVRHSKNLTSGGGNIARHNV